MFESRKFHSWLNKEARKRHTNIVIGYVYKTILDTVSPQGLCKDAATFTVDYRNTPINVSLTSRKLRVDTSLGHHHLHFTLPAEFLTDKLKDKVEMLCKRIDIIKEQIAYTEMHSSQIDNLTPVQRDNLYKVARKSGYITDPKNMRRIDFEMLNWHIYNILNKEK